MTAQAPCLGVVVLAATAVIHAACGETAPSNVPLAQGTVLVGVFQTVVIHFQVDRSRTLSSRVDWNGAANDLDSFLIRGHCTSDQIQAQVPGCHVLAYLRLDRGPAKPSVFSVSV